MAMQVDDEPATGEVEVPTTRAAARAMQVEICQVKYFASVLRIRRYQMPLWLTRLKMTITQVEPPAKRKIGRARKESMALPVRDLL